MDKNDEEFNVKSKLYSKLKKSRDVSSQSLPTDLAKFYSHHEGCGLASSPEIPIRFCRLDEVKRCAWRDVHIFGSDECPGWESFDAYFIGLGSFFEEFFCVVSAPVCQPGSILMIGVDVPGPGGTGPTLEPSLVLASSFTEWLNRLKKDAWLELHNGPGDETFYRMLNPEIMWSQ